MKRCLVVLPLLANAVRIRTLLFDAHRTCTHLASKWHWQSSTIISDCGASIRDIHHERAWLHTHMDQVQIECIIEVTGGAHQH
jgi:hypothetical protein